MKSYRLSKAAEIDLVAIAEHIAIDSPVAAISVVERIERAFSFLGDNPGVGRLRNDVSDESVRSWIVDSYVIVYRERKRRIEVVRILHGARDIGAIINE